MSIKSQGGVFGRNPTFNDVTVDGDLSIAGTLSVGGETITGLSYQGGWNADTNTPDIAASSPVTGQFWIVSTDGSTDVGGITNWTSGDWALYDGTNWQRVEGGNTDLTTGVSGQLAVANGGTGAADAATARTNLGLGTAATTAATDYATSAQGSLADSALQPADIGSTVQGYDATILTSSDIGSTVQGYDASILTSSDIGSTVQGYDADTTKNDVSNTFTQDQSFSGNVGIGIASPATQLHLSKTTGPVVRLENLTAGSYTGLSMGKIEWRTGDASAPGVAGSIDVQDYNNFGTAFKMILGGGLVGSTVTGLELDALGNATIPTGNLVIGTSGQGIDFSATSGTGTSELLDDYEEGTWTPAYDTTSGDLTATHDLQFGAYTKVGRLVTASFFLRTDAISGGTGLVIVKNLPFVSKSTAYYYHSANLGYRRYFSVSPIFGKLSNNSDYVILYTAAYTAMVPSDLGTTTNDNWLEGQITYIV
jgi:hypothetical protein